MGILLSHRAMDAKTGDAICVIKGCLSLIGHQCATQAYMPYRPTIPQGPAPFGGISRTFLLAKLASSQRIGGCVVQAAVHLHPDQQADGPRQQ